MTRHLEHPVFQNNKKEREKALQAAAKRKDHGKIRRLPQGMTGEMLSEEKKKKNEEY